MYDYLKFRENWTTNMGDMAKGPYFQFFMLLSFFSLNPSISKFVLLHVSLNISNIIVDNMNMKLHKCLGFDGPKCTHVFKFCR